MHSHMIETERSHNVLQTEVTAFVRFRPDAINSKVQLFVLDQILHSLGGWTVGGTTSRWKTYWWFKTPIFILISSASC